MTPWNSWDCARLKPAVQSSIQVPSWVTGTQVLNHDLLPLREHIRRNLELGLELGLKHQHSVKGCRYSKHCLNSCTEHQPSLNLFKMRRSECGASCMVGICLLKEPENIQVQKSVQVSGSWEEEEWGPGSLWEKGAESEKIRANMRLVGRLAQSQCFPQHLLLATPLPTWLVSVMRHTKALPTCYDL